MLGLIAVPTCCALATRVSRLELIFRSGDVPRKTPIFMHVHLVPTFIRTTFTPAQVLYKNSESELRIVNLVYFAFVIVEKFGEVLRIQDVIEY